MSNLEFLKPLILDLNNKNKKTLCHQILDFYFETAFSIDYLDIIGYLSLKCDHRALYLKCAERAVQLSQTNDQLLRAKQNWYKALNTMNYPDTVLFYIDKQLQIDPENVDLWLEKIGALSLCNQKEESQRLKKSLIKKFPQHEKKLSFGRHSELLTSGKLAEGVLHFLNEYRKESSLFQHQLKMQKWTGQILPGATIYVEGEGGLGDEIINIRFFKMIQDLGMKPILYSNWVNYKKDVIDLFRRHNIDVITETYSIDVRQLWTPLMTLPGYLGLNEQQLWYGPYLQPSSKLSNKLETAKFRVGIKCNGNPYFGQDEYRKIPLESMLEIIPDNCDVYYIDKDFKTNHPRIVNLSDRITDWEDTLDFISQMDCVISSCTSLVHAAGAVGKTTMVAVPICEYYIWTTSRKDNSSPWYGNNFFVYKQTKLRDWSEPLNNIKQHLTKLINDKSSTL